MVGEGEARGPACSRVIECLEAWVRPSLGFHSGCSKKPMEGFEERSDKLSLAHPGQVS